MLRGHADTVSVPLLVRSVAHPGRLLRYDTIRHGGGGQGGGRGGGGEGGGEGGGGDGVVAMEAEETEAVARAAVMGAGTAEEGLEEARRRRRRRRRRG